MNSICKTNYPILLVHGSNCRDYGLIDSWGRIPDVLRKNGAKVYFGQQDGWGTIEENAEFIKNRIFKIIKKTNCKKINIIAHSKGGLDCRYMLQMFHMSCYVASLTTIATPHHGSKGVDIYCRLPDFCKKAIAIPVDFKCRLMGDKNPNFLKGFQQMSTSYCSLFNQQIQDCPDTYYQSTISIMKSFRSDFLYAVPYLIIFLLEGKNDGLVSVQSAKWGNFRGVIQTKAKRGISHIDIVDYRKKTLSNFNVLQFYIHLVKDLKQRGF